MDRHNEHATLVVLLKQRNGLNLSVRKKKYYEMYHCQFRNILPLFFHRYFACVQECVRVRGSVSGTCIFVKRELNVTK